MTGPASCGSKSLLENSGGACVSGAMPGGERLSGNWQAEAMRAYLITGNPGSGTRPEGGEPSPDRFASAHCHASTCASRPRPAGRSPASGRATPGRPADAASVGRLRTRRTAAGTSQRPQRDAPRASAAHTRRSARTTATPRSPGPYPSAPRQPRSPPGSPHCPLLMRPTAAGRRGRPTATLPAASSTLPRSSRPPIAPSASPPTPAARAARPACACAGRTRSGRSGRMPTHPIVVRRIHLSVRPVMPCHQRESRRTARRRRQMVQLAPRTPSNCQCWLGLTCTSVRTAPVSGSSPGW
jgi:hypothetical protein